MDRPVLSVQGIRELLPHRFPMLLVDRVLEITPGEVAAEKLVSGNDPFLAGHFPDRPIMPGVLLIEAMAQAAAIWVLSREPQLRGKGAALLAVRKARFRRPVVPGDVMHLAARFLRRKGAFYRFEGTTSVRGDIVAEAEFTAAFLDWGERP